MLSERLKEATKPAHLNLEKIVVQQLKNIRSNEDYSAFLLKFYTYFSQVEKVIKPYMTTQLLPDYLERRNSSYLKKDIEILGGNVQDIQEIEVPKIFNEVSALGALYVMEGSIMGGRIIIQMLQKLEIDTGISFFTGYGQDTGDKWGIFTKVMNETASSESQQDETISAANQTFALFEKVFA